MSSLMTINKTIFVMIFLNLVATQNNNSTNLTCSLPAGLTYRKIHYLDCPSCKQFMSRTDFDGFLLYVRSVQHQFEINKKSIEETLKNCSQFNDRQAILKIDFPKKFTLKKYFNLQAAFDLLETVNPDSYVLDLNNLYGIELDLGIKLASPRSNLVRPSYFQADILNTRLDFRVNGKPVKSCADMREANLSSPRSLFQIAPKDQYLDLLLYNAHFVRPLCPLVFNNARIELLIIRGMMNTFYKRNFLSFNNDTSVDIDSRIIDVEISFCENIEIDRKLLDPVVFKNLSG